MNYNHKQRKIRLAQKMIMIMLMTGPVPGGKVGGKPVWNTAGVNGRGKQSTTRKSTLVPISTIANESSHEISNDNEVRVLHFDV